MVHRKGTAWKEEELALIADYYEQGKTSSWISDEFGITTSMLYKVMHKNGLEHYLKSQRKWTTKEEKALINDYENGMPVDLLAAKYGYKREKSVYVYLHKAAKRNGITLHRYWVDYFRRKQKDFEY